MYTAATVLLAERLLPSETSNGMTPPSARETSWSHAIEILKAYSRISESAARCLAALEILSAKVPRDPHDVPSRGTEYEQDAMVEMAIPDMTTTMMTDGTTDPARPYDETSVPFDLGGFDFDIDDMMWLNSSAGEIMF